MTTRDSYFDNAKFILIFLVVFGHFLRSFINDHVLFQSLYVTIYTFHMPAFIFIAGYFAKGSASKGYIWNVFKKLIIPYLIFQLIYSIYHYNTESKQVFGAEMFDPYWSLWFLISLFFWNILIILFKTMDWKLGIIISILISISVGYIDQVTNYLSLSRTIVFFPFFLIGYYASSDHVSILQKNKVRILALLILGLTFSFFTIWNEFSYEWLFGSKPYSYFEVELIKGPLIRLAIYFLSFVMMLSCLSLIPTKKLFFTNLGTRSLYVYLLHGAFIKTFRDSELKSTLAGIETIIILVVVSFVITLLLSSNFVKALAQPIIELKISSLKNRVKKLRPFITLRKNFD
jgi:fucose 4-O-acetylase-like acetyltransferase